MSPESESSWDYDSFLVNNKKLKQALLENPKRFQTISEREDRSDHSLETVKTQVKGRYFIRHRGCMLMKTPNDLAIMKELFALVRPAIVIELGTLTGGSALWISDTLQLEGVTSSVFSMDIAIDRVEEKVKELKPNNLTFVQGDSNKISESFFSNDFLKTQPHPWVVIDDVHVNVRGIMEHFGAHMETGDYFLVEKIPGEDGILDHEHVPVGYDMLDQVKTFLKKRKEFAVDSYLTDLFGYNKKWNWNGYIRRM